jgi:hypothetical protein
MPKRSPPPDRREYSGQDAGGLLIAISSARFALATSAASVPHENTIEIYYRFILDANPFG